MLNAYKNYGISKLRKFNAKKDIKDVFTNIYKHNNWGGIKGSFFSGSGSLDKYTENYVSEVKEFIKENKIKTVIDLGCGDFSVGRKIVNDDIIYEGIDIVDELIKNNNESFGKINVQFLSKNIVKDEIQQGDLCLIRQVFQHLSNDEIISVLRKIHKFKFTIVTEHYPSEKIKNIIPNKDKPHGPDTRIYDNSAVYLDKPPFNCVIKKKISEIIIDDYLVNEGEKIISFLI